MNDTWLIVEAVLGVIGSAVVISGIPGLIWLYREDERSSWTRYGHYDPRPMPWYVRYHPIELLRRTLLDWGWL